MNIDTSMSTIVGIVVIIILVLMMTGVIHCGTDQP